MKASERAFLSIASFFDAYALAVQDFNARALVQLYAMPCLITSDDAHAAFTEPGRLEGIINQGFAFYRHQGIAHAAPDVRSKMRITESLAQVKVRWTYFNADHQPVYDCDYQYLLHLDKNGEWKIQMSVSINEKEKMQSLMREGHEEV